MRIGLGPRGSRRGGNLASRADDADFGQAWLSDIAAAAPAACSVRAWQLGARAGAGLVARGPEPLRFPAVACAWGSCVACPAGLQPWSLIFLPTIRCRYFFLLPQVQPTAFVRCRLQRPESECRAAPGSTPGRCLVAAPGLESRPWPGAPAGRKRRRLPVSAAGSAALLASGQQAAKPAPQRSREDGGRDGALGLPHPQGLRPRAALGGAQHELRTSVPSPLGPVAVLVLGSLGALLRSPAARSRVCTGSAAPGPSLIGWAGVLVVRPWAWPRSLPGRAALLVPHTRRLLGSGGGPVACLTWRSARSWRLACRDGKGLACEKKRLPGSHDNLRRKPCDGEPSRVLQALPSGGTSTARAKSARPGAGALPCEPRTSWGTS